MKKVTLTGKLTLNKETISKLNETQMSQVVGAGVFSWFGNTCKKNDSACNPTRCGDGNTGNTASGNCSCPQVCNAV